jgi:hypothetical protein
MHVEIAIVKNILHYFDTPKPLVGNPGFEMKIVSKKGKSTNSYLQTLLPKLLPSKSSLLSTRNNRPDANDLLMQNRPYTPPTKEPWYYRVHAGPPLGSDNFKQNYVKKILAKIINFSISSISVGFVSFQSPLMIWLITQSACCAGGPQNHLVWHYASTLDSFVQRAHLIR